MSLSLWIILYCSLCRFWLLLNAWWIWIITMGFLCWLLSLFFSDTAQIVSIYLSHTSTRGISWKLLVINNCHAIGKGHLNSYSGICSDGCCMITMTCTTQPMACVWWPWKRSAEEKKWTSTSQQISSEMLWQIRKPGKYHEFHRMYSTSLSFPNISISIASYTLVYDHHNPYPFPDLACNSDRILWTFECDRFDVVLMPTHKLSPAWFVHLIWGDCAECDLMLPVNIMTCCIGVRGKSRNGCHSFIMNWSLDCRYASLLSQSMVILKHDIIIGVIIWGPGNSECTCAPPACFLVSWEHTSCNFALQGPVSALVTRTSVILWHRSSSPQWNYDQVQTPDRSKHTCPP